jgi:dimethylamine/trimethylamine dehydrogenase
VDFDTLIVVTGRKSNNALHRGLKDRKAEWEPNGIKAVYIIGDAWAPKLIADATFEGHRLAREIEEPNAQFPKPYRREVAVYGVPYNQGDATDIRYET